VPLINGIGARLMELGIDLSQPGWFWVLGALLFPITLFILGLALVYELTTRLDFRHALPASVHWVIAITLVTGALLVVVYWAAIAPPPLTPRA
jgi:hypothetical protein